MPSTGLADGDTVGVTVMDGVAAGVGVGVGGTTAHGGGPSSQETEPSAMGLAQHSGLVPPWHDAAPQVGQEAAQHAVPFEFNTPVAHVGSAPATSHGASTSLHDGPLTRIQYGQHSSTPPGRSSQLRPLQRPHDVAQHASPRLLSTPESHRGSEADTGDVDRTSAAASSASENVTFDTFIVAWMFD